MFKGSRTPWTRARGPRCGTHVSRLLCHSSISLRLSSWLCDGVLLWPPRTVMPVPAACRISLVRNLLSLEARATSSARLARKTVREVRTHPSGKKAGATCLASSSSPRSWRPEAPRWYTTKCCCYKQRIQLSSVSIGHHLGRYMIRLGGVAWDPEKTEPMTMPDLLRGSPDRSASPEARR